MLNLKFYTINKLIQILLVLSEKRTKKLINKKTIILSLRIKWLLKKLIEKLLLKLIFIKHVFRIKLKVAVISF